MGVSYLYRCFRDELYDLQIPLVQAFNRNDLQNITKIIDQKLNAQAEAPMLLESALDPAEKGGYTFDIIENQVSFMPAIKEIVEDKLAGISTGRISAKFHNTLVELIIQLSKQIRAESGLNRIVLGGGTFQNRYLSENVLNKLAKERFQVYLSRRIPVNDQGIAAGQLAIGASRRRLM